MYLSNCLSQTQPDGVFQNQINFRLIRSGPTPVPWLFAWRHQPNWWDVVNFKEHRFPDITHNARLWLASLPRKKSIWVPQAARGRPDQQFTVSESSRKTFLWDPKRIVLILHPIFLMPCAWCLYKGNDLITKTRTARLWSACWIHRVRCDNGMPET